VSGGVRFQKKAFVGGYNMEEGRPSSTAIGAAMLRAAHWLLDDEPKILRDAFALGLSGIESETALRAAIDRMQAAFAQRYGFELSSIRNWEQGRRQPEGPARLLLLMIDKEPEAVHRALAG